MKKIGIIGLLWGCHLWATVDNAITYTDQAMDRYRQSDITCFQDSAHDLLDQAHYVLTGENSGISRTLATNQQRVQVFKLLLHGRLTGYNKFFPHRYNLGTLSDHEFKHIITFNFMTELIDDMITDPLSFTNMADIMNYISRKCNLFIQDEPDDTPYHAKIKEVYERLSDDYYINKFLPDDFFNMYCASYDYPHIPKDQKQRIKDITGFSRFHTLNMSYSPMAPRVVLCDQNIFLNPTMFNLYVDPAFSKDPYNHYDYNTYLEVLDSIQRRHLEKYEEDSDEKTDEIYYSDDQQEDDTFFDFFPEERLIKIGQELDHIPQGTNVHAMTARIAKPHYPFLIHIYQMLQDMTPPIDHLLTFDEVYEQFSVFLDSDDPHIVSRLDAFKAAMKKIQVYYQNPIDSETQIHLPELMTYCIKLICFDVKNDGDYFERLGLLFNCISENTEESGGCHPGVTGRLFIIFYHMISAYYTKAKEEYSSYYE